MRIASINEDTELVLRNKINYEVTAVRNGLLCQTSNFVVFISTKGIKI